MSRDWWPEDGTWPGETFGEAFRPAAGKGGIRVMHQGVGEPEAEFRARVATARATEPPGTLWICVTRSACAAE